MPTIDLPNEGETTCSLSGGKLRMASTALTDLPLVFKIMETSKVLLTIKVPDEGLKNRDAPLCSWALTRKLPPTNGENNTDNIATTNTVFLVTSVNYIRFYFIGDENFFLDI